MKITAVEPAEELIDDDLSGAEWDDAPERVPGQKVTKWELRKIRTRRMILRAGRELFAHQGFDSPRVEDIARAAGISRAAFYLHYKSIDEMVQAVFVREVRWQLRRYRSIDGDILQNPRRIRGWLERFFASFRAERQYVLIIFRAYSMDPANVRLVFEEQHRLIRRLAWRVPELGLLTESGELDTDRVIRLASFLRRIETMSLYSAFDALEPDHFNRALDLLSSDLAEFAANGSGKGTKSDRR